MPAYTLPAARVAAAGNSSQLAVLVAPRNDPTSAPHAAVGDPIYLVSPRTKTTTAHRFAARVCVLRASLAMTETALLRVFDLSLSGSSLEAEHFDRLLRTGEQGVADPAPSLAALARALGFDSWAEAYRWNAAGDRRGRPDAAGRITRELVVWGHA